MVKYTILQAIRSAAGHSMVERAGPYGAHLKAVRKAKLPENLVWRKILPTVTQFLVVDPVAILKGE